MSEKITECNTVDKKTTQYIVRNISQKFIDTWMQLSDTSVPPQAILRGLALTLSFMMSNTMEAKNSGDEIAKIIDDVAQLLKKSEKKGVDFVSQAAALSYCVPSLLGIDYKNLE